MKEIKIINELNLKLSETEMYLIDFWIEKELSSSYDLPVIVPVNNRIMLDFHSYETEGILIMGFSKKWLGKTKTNFKNKK